VRPTWTNWLGNQRAAPVELVTPASVAEVVDVVARARARRLSVRVVGAGAGWSPLVPVDGCLLSMAALRAVQNVDTARQRITVEAGALLGSVVDVAARHGLSLRSPSMYLGLSVGGLIATGSHGTGRDVATFGDSVVGFELVAADGSVHRVNEPGSDLWRAAITNLGALGVLTSVTLQCEALYNVQEIHERVPAGEAAALIPAMRREYEFVSLFWYPSSRWTLFKLGNRTSLPAEDIRGRLRPSLAERVRALSGPLLPKLVERAPFVEGLLADVMGAGIGVGARVVSEPHFAHYQQAYPPVISSEFAIPVERAPEAWAWLHGRLMQYWRSGVRPVNLVVHARFGSPSEALLASSAGRATCHLEVLSFEGNRARALFESEFDEKMRGEFSGRPHWGKDMVNPRRAAEMYGDNLDRFLEIRRGLDPEQRFLNAFLRDEVFGLGRRLARSPAR
jgi:FAD/FMN-containing dehydrogenase